VDPEMPKLAVMVFGFAAIPGGFDLAPIGGGGCRLYTSLDTLAPFALTGTFRATASRCRLRPPWPASASRLRLRR
jgi:hypothetical protein